MLDSALLIFCWVTIWYDRASWPPRKGPLLTNTSSRQHFPYWYRLRGGQGIVEGNESICCLCLLVACSRCWHSLRLAERDRIKRPTRYLLLYGVRIGCNDGHRPGR